ncbi:MAG: AAA family ATPase [Leptothrix ochracea]|uniref:AAA family ATPase n=1 Tax=Leptothrix ochracea TaxID=735331 RepID=UPI0034E2AD82
MIPGYVLGERIHRSALHNIYRAVRLDDAQPVIIKTLEAPYPDRTHVAALRREGSILQRLHTGHESVIGVVRLLDQMAHGHGNWALVLVALDHDLGTARRRQPGQVFPVERCLAIAIDLSLVLAKIHALDMVHKRLQPSSVLFDAAGTLFLSDFNGACELGLERQSPDAMAQQSPASWPYLSPEQTGRMNRDLDHRSDGYALGVLLFEMLTGQWPFQAETVLAWVHSHISKPPLSPSDLNPSIPLMVSAVVLKLLAKNAEDRYQSGFGLLNDLRRCQQDWRQTGTVAPFVLGQHDISSKLQIPQRLYGREPELAALMALFEQVAAGQTELCMVSGYSGVGKSALVNELSKPLVRRQGYLIQGKFDQFQRGTPYAAVAMAFRALARQWLAESPERLQAWRSKLVAAVEPNGQVLIDLIPELALILGPQPAVPELPRAEAQNRFQLTLLNFVRVITRDQPLVIFLDDLQFSDVATLHLIRWLAAARDLQRVMLIGAYRSNEVGAGHPLRLMLNEVEGLRRVHAWPLQPLDLASVEALVADTLSTDRASVQPLSALLHDQVEGNPFFLNETLRTLAQERVLHFSPHLGRWQWAMAAVRRHGLSGNVVDLVVSNLRKLDPATQRVLQLAACIGNTFDLRTLSIIREASMDQTGAELLPALQRYMVLPLHADYKLVGQAAGAGTGLNPSYRFQHDRVQQAAYALIDEDRKQAVHLSIGRLIQRHASEDERREQLINIVGHLNEGRRLIEDPAERLALAAMNLAAGILAQRSSAYESARGYLQIGQDLLPADAWDSAYTLTLALAMESQQCAYLTAQFDEAERGIEQMLSQARTALEKAEILSMRTRQYATTGRMVESIEAAIMGLNLLGIRFLADPDRAAIARERASVRRALAGRRIADLIHAPPLTDPHQQVAIRLLMEIFPAAFLSGSGNLFPFLVLKSVAISLRGGNSPESAFAYAAYGMLLCGVLEDPALGFEFGQLAVAMNEQFDDIALKSRVIYLYTMFIHHWSRPWASMTPWFRKGIEAGYQSGDLLYLAYSAQDCIIWDPSLDLEAAEREHADYLQIVRDCAYQDSFDSGSLFLQMQRNFLGRTDALCSMNDASFDEQRCVAGMVERHFMTGIANHHIYKVEICFLYGALDQALVHVRAQDQLMASAMSLPQLVRYHIVAFLTLAACLPAMSAEEQARTRQRLVRDHQRMRRWARHCPDNFLHLQLLMQAELARLDGRIEAALRAYERAIDAAHASGFIRDEAMAHELAGRHLWSVGRHKAAEGYLRAALHLYERWGAKRKVEHLSEEFAAIFKVRHAGLAGTGAATLDMASVMKASQAISGEIVLEQLWTTTMRIMLENAGGQRGCFVVSKDGALHIEGWVSEDAPDRSAVETLLPMAIVHQVLHSHAPVVLNDASRAGHFARDPYLLAHRPQSVLCIPLQRQGKFEGAIYMENRLAVGAFTEDRIEVLRLLAAQVSISIENAKLYEDQSRLIEAQSHFVPSEFLESLNHHDLARVSLGEHVAKRMSVLFCDLRGFTPLAERLDPRTVIALLNQFFSSMERPITQSGGFIDSFAGDEIKGLFDQASTDAAVQAAVGMWRALDALNEHLRATDQPTLLMGVGLNTGPVVLGTVGARQRIQCSVIGDTVNLASRIEQLTKLYGAPLLIGEHTFRALAQPEAWAIRKVDRVAVKGKNTAVELYEVIDAEQPERRAAKLATAPLLEAAMQAYFGRDFVGALALLQQIIERDPEDLVPPLFVERCHRYLAAPPSADWQGFEKLTSK